VWGPRRTGGVVAAVERRLPARLNDRVPVQDSSARADIFRMRGGRGSLGVTWVAATLFAALVVATPAAAMVVGDAAGATLAPPSVETSGPRITGVAAEPISREPHSRERTDRPSSTPPALMVRVTRDLAVRARPSAGAGVIGILPSVSKYYHVPITAWVEAVSRSGDWGEVEVPYVSPRRDGWIRLAGLRRTSTTIAVDVDLSAHRLTVTKAGRALFSFPAATGTATSPTPSGDYFVTDRIAFSAGGPLGSFAFGISGIQPRLPAGWSGGNQLAIHGTYNPASIGTSASAGCVRVSEVALARLRPLLALGTPVLIHA
jgi:lipoprotein-anchoring transpeptidase ErfK/SrfK